MRETPGCQPGLVKDEHLYQSTAARHYVQRLFRLCALLLAIQSIIPRGTYPSLPKAKRGSVREHERNILQNRRML